MSREKENQCLEEFISVYQSEKCLWKVKSADYHDRMKKEAAYGRLIEVWKQVDPNCNKSTVLKKINNLRSSYRKELKKVREATKSGASAEDVYLPKLWYYNLLHFLDDQETPRQSRSNLSEDEQVGNNENEESTPSVDVHDDSMRIAPSEDIEVHDIESTALPASSNSNVNRSKVSSRPKPADNVTLTHEVLTTVQNHFKTPKNPDDRFDAFGKTIALKLRELPNDQRRWAEKFINDVLFEAEGGNLGSNFALVNQRPYEYQQYQSFSPRQFPPMRNISTTNYSPSTSISSQHGNSTPYQSPQSNQNVTPPPNSQVYVDLNASQSQDQRTTNALVTFLSEYNDVS
ncbi:uncharacterized protein LOC128994012 [Macrosteles quadrilineatus]|uniref:uncharacterized protein LOC128984629 n=1 Tax=Macrosteles quadrilineatus TaxID=74068 RepID=UPI0023E1ACE2|nr:uncharacterized protein LOC128984629 [Macrosteles quadrilineatus]XP_054274183.1 uncharacterized protein LOC128994012 [Macrosteles quadrilineatus]